MVATCFGVPLRKGRQLLDYATLLDTSLLTGEVAKVVKFGATNLTILVDCD